MGSVGGTATLASAAGAVATAAYVVGLFGNATALFLYASSVCTFINIGRNRAVPKEVSVLPYMAGLMTCIVWGMFGLPSVHPGSELAVAINAIGLLCNFIYTMSFLCFAGDRCFLWFILLAIEVMMTVGLGALVLIVPESRDRKAFWLGLWGDICATLMYGLPLMKMWSVKTTGNVQLIYLPMAAAELLNPVVWIIYACIGKFNTVVFIPNLIGALVGVLQLAVYYYYYYTGAAAGNAEIA